jgi:hypothetical protein
MDPRSEEITPEQVLHAAAARLLDVQVETYHALDARNANIISVSSTVLPLAFGLLAIRDQEIPATAEKALAGAVVCYALVLIFAWFSSRIRALEYRPHLPTLRTHTSRYSGPVLQRWVANEYVSATMENEIALQRKAQRIGWANTLLYLEGLFLAVAAALTLL